MIPLFKIFAGFSLLAVGRKLFWLFVAVVGFQFGLFVAVRLFHAESDLVALVIAVAAGLLGALLAVFVQQLVVAGAGFVAGGYLLVGLLEMFGANLGRFDWVVFIIGGIIGLAFVAMLFDWALIILSSLIGALTITEVILPRHGLLTFFVTLVLCLVGVSIQAGLWRTEQRRRM